MAAPLGTGAFTEETGQEKQVGEPLGEGGGVRPAPTGLAARPSFQSFAGIGFFCCPSGECRALIGCVGVGWAGLPSYSRWRRGGCVGLVGWDGGDWGWDGPGMGIMGVGVTWDGITGLGEGWDRGTGMGMGWDRDNWDGNDEIEMIGMEVIGMGGGWDRGTGGVKMGVNGMGVLGWEWEEAGGMWVLGGCGCWGLG